MKSIQIIKPGEVAVIETVKPVPAKHEVLLKIKLIGLCGSDLSSYLGKNPMVNYPVVPGHEIAAEIVSCGSDVPQHLTEGMLVTVNPYTHCSSCPACKNQRFNACQYNQTLGVQRNGALSEYITVPWSKILYHEKLNALELVLTEPLSVGFHAVDRGRVSDSDICVVLGCGMIGIGAIVRASLQGAKVVAVDIDGEKLKLAVELGADFIINSADQDLHHELQAITNGAGPDVVIEAAGNPVTYLAAIDEVAFTGRVVCIGYAKSDISFATQLFVQKELDIMGSRNAMPKDIEAVMKYLGRKNCPVDKLVSKRVSIEVTGEGLEYWSKHAGEVLKIIVEVSN